MHVYIYIYMYVYMYSYMYIYTLSFLKPEREFVLRFVYDFFCRGAHEWYGLFYDLCVKCPLLPTTR